MNAVVHFEMTSEHQETGSGTNLGARLPEVDFGVVLSRVMESTERDPAQLRNAIYELARIKRRTEVYTLANKSWGGETLDASARVRD